MVVDWRQLVVIVGLYWEFARGELTECQVSPGVLNGIKS